MEKSSRFRIGNMEFANRNEMADYLVSHFSKCWELLKELDMLIQDHFDYEGYLGIKKLIKANDNLVTLAIYFLDPRKRIVTKEHLFNSVEDIITRMKAFFPDRIEDIDTLLSDPILSSLVYYEFRLTTELRYKRQHAFLKNVEDNYDSSFLYFYMIFMYLSANEAVSFTLYGQKRYQLNDIASILKEHPKDFIRILKEIHSNDIVMALLATRVGVTEIKEHCTQYGIYGLLYILDSYFGNLQFLLCDDVTFYMQKNYSNYTYNNPLALAVRKSYEGIVIKSEGDFLEICKHASVLKELYHDFERLFTRDFLLDLAYVIKANDFKHYLLYADNGYHVPLDFLVLHGKEVDISKGLAAEKKILQQKMDEVLVCRNDCENALQQKKENFKIKTRNFAFLYMLISMTTMAITILLVIQKNEMPETILYIGALIASIIAFIHCIYILHLYIKLRSYSKEHDYLKSMFSSEYAAISNLTSHHNNPLNDCSILRSTLNGYDLFSSHKDRIQRLRRPGISIKSLKLLYGIFYYSGFKWLLSFAEINYFIKYFSIVGITLALLNAIAIITRRKYVFLSYTVFSILVVVFYWCFGGNI